MLNSVRPYQNVHILPTNWIVLVFTDDQIDKVNINDDPTETEFVGQMATLSSWGLESETISRQILKVAYPTILKKESCLIHDQISQICVESVCGVSYFKYSSIFSIYITKCHIQGNGGSPLHLLDNNEYGSAYMSNHYTVNQHVSDKHFI